jgi:protein-S-isoprenylcysteine O-methyltransferase Ste14
MLPEFYIACFVSVCLIVFFSLNSLNLFRTRRDRHEKTTIAHADVERPTDFSVSLAALGTSSFFAESIAYPFVVFTGLFSIIDQFPLQLRFQNDTYVQIIGISLETFGYFLFLWSVLARGRCTTSWAMRENHKLVTSGPYRHIRHPSYLAYFLLFSGLFFMLLNLLATVPLLAIPGYLRLAPYEEQLLIKRFGKDYLEYQKRTGRFLPSIKH